MNQKKKTIFQQILIVNMLLSLLFICIFLGNYLYANDKFKREADQHSEQILQTVIQNFHADTVRLTTFMEMSKSDPAFILSFSNMLSINVRYGREASQRLSTLKYSLPYVENVYAYIKNSDKFILTQNVILNKELFYKEVFQKSNPGASLPDFAVLEDGFHIIDNTNYYINNYYDQGVLILQFAGERFGGINQIASILADYEMVILTSDNQVFSASSSLAREMVGEIRPDGDLSEYITYEGQKYYLKNRLIQNGFQFMLLEKTSKVQQFYNQSNIIYFVAGVILFVGCALQIYLNNMIYRPLKTIARKYKSKGEGGNEIEIISGKINEIMNENVDMQLQISDSHKLLLDIEFQYMLHAKHSISDKLAKQLYSQYGNYRMMTIAAQSHAGGADRLFELLNDYFIDTLECKSIVMGELVQTYIVSAVYEPAEIVAIVSGYFDETSLDAVVYIGVSNWSDNFQQLHVLYAEAMERMLSNQMGGHKSYGIVVADRDGDKKPPATITMEIINTIATHAVKGSPQDVQTVLEQLFVLDQSMRLRDVISYYEQLSSLLLMLINQSGNGADAETFKCVQQRLYYNPYYMYNLLLEDFKRLNACVSQPTQSLKYEVIDYINQHYMEVLSLDSISEIFGITPVYLSSWFKKNTGVNLSAYIANVRMEEAKRLLATNQNLKIAEVSASVGIPVASTFIRQFKNYFGCTPDQYRQLVLTERHASKPSNAEAGQADD